MKFREPDYTDSRAHFSACNRFRYSLTRAWDRTKPRVCFIMLNPSTADAVKLDPTLRRCVGFAMRWGCGSMEVVNLFALRATDPACLYVSDVRGDDLQNDCSIIRASSSADFGTIAAWGVHGAYHNRGIGIACLLSIIDKGFHGDSIMCLRLTKDRHPAHPLYLPADLTPIPFFARERKPR